MLTPAGILDCGTAHSFALGKAVIDEDRAAPEGVMMPQPQAETNAVSKVAGQGGCSRGEEGIRAFAQGPGVQRRAVLDIAQAVTRSQN